LTMPPKDVSHHGLLLKVYGWRSSTVHRGHQPRLSIRHCHAREEHPRCWEGVQRGGGTGNDAQAWRLATHRAAPHALYCTTSLNHAGSEARGAGANAASAPPGEGGEIQTDIPLLVPPLILCLDASCPRTGDAPDSPALASASVTP